MTLFNFCNYFLQQAKSEAAAAFGNDGVYLEKFVQNPRHIEFQVFGNQSGGRYCTYNVFSVFFGVARFAIKIGLFEMYLGRDLAKRRGR